MVYNVDSNIRSSKAKVAVGRYPLKCTNVLIKSQHRSHSRVIACAEKTRVFRHRKKYADVLITFDTYTFKGENATIYPEKSLIILKGNVVLEDGINSYKGTVAKVTFDSTIPVININ